MFASTSLAAPRLYFDPENANAAKGIDRKIDLKIDVENKSAFGADATLTFPSNDFTIKAVDNGGFFSDFSYALSDGKIEIHAYFSTLYNSKSGNGNFATITVNSNKDSGDGNLTFVCSANSTETEILDSNGENILTCSSLNQEHLAYTVTENGPTNACGGTCGSNYNCNNGLFCFQGFCRNPNCRNDSTCGCKQTATPKPTVKPTLKPVIKSTPTIVTLAKYTIPSPIPTASEVPQETTNQSFDYVRVGIWTALFLLFLLLLLGLVRLFKKDDNPPQISSTSSEPIEQLEPVQTETESLQQEPTTQPQDPDSPQPPIV